jgi:hypothetical protein
MPTTLIDQRAQVLADAVVSGYLAELSRPRPRPAVAAAAAPPSRRHAPASPRARLTARRAPARRAIAAC